MVVDSAHGNSVDFRAYACVQESVERFGHLSEKIVSRDPGESFRTEAVNGKIDGVDPGLLQHGDVGPHEGAVARDPQVEVRKILPESKEELVEVPARKGLAACETHLVHVHAPCDADQTDDLLVTEHVLMGNELLRPVAAAVDAVQIAAVRYGKTQVADPALIGIGDVVLFAHDVLTLSVLDR